MFAKDSKGQSIRYGYLEGYDARRTEPPRSTSKSGYGSKIPTQWLVHSRGKWKRVYCAIYSNSGTCYILEAGKRIIVEVTTKDN